jgi:hypothetical protein
VFYVIKILKSPAPWTIKKRATFGGVARLLREPAEAGWSGGRRCAGCLDFELVRFQVALAGDTELRATGGNALAIDFQHDRVLVEVMGTDAVGLNARDVVLALVHSHGIVADLADVDFRRGAGGKHCLDDRGKAIERQLAGIACTLIHG